jgi:hypothetical protein
VATKEEFWIIEFEENNVLPEGYSQSEYESKGFVESKLIQDFPLRGRPVYLRIKRQVGIQPYQPKRFKESKWGVCLNHDCL